MTGAPAEAAGEQARAVLPVRGWSLLPALSAAAAVAAFLVVEVYDLDVFWIVTIGRDILATRSVPAADRYTVAGLGHPYQDIHWLFQVAAALAHAAAGWAGVGLLAAAVWALTLLLVYRASARHAPAALAAVLVFLAAMASAERFLPRPEIATFLGIALFWERLAAGRFRSRRDVALLVLAQAAWANAHGLFVLGPFLAGCYLLEALARGRREADGTAPALGRLLGLLLLATLATPHLLRGWTYAWLLVTQVGPGASRLMRSLAELSPTFGEAFRSSPAFWFYLALLVVTAVPAAVAAARRAVPAARLLAVLGLLAASVTGRRNVVLFALAAAPFCAEALAAAAPGLLRRLSGRVPAVAFSAAMLCWSVYPLSGRYYLAMGLPARFGLGVTPSFFPHGLPAFLDRIGFQGAVYNSNSIGGFYLFHGFPRRLPLTEGRWTAYDEADVVRILSAPADPALFRRVVEEYRIEGLVLHHASPDTRPLLRRLPSDPSWRLVWYDHAASLWLRAGRFGHVPAVDLARGLDLPPPPREDDALILDQLYRSVGPVALGPRIENLRRAAAFGWRRAEVLGWLGGLEVEAGRLGEAERTFRALLEADPSSTLARNELAYLAARRGDAALAERLLSEVVRLDPADVEAAENLQRIRRARRR